MAHIKTEDLVNFKKNGFLVQHELMSAAEIANLVHCVDAFALTEQPGHLLEQQTNVYRAFHGCHLYSDEFRTLIRRADLLEPARQILGDDVYIHQLKVNLKQAFSGEMWPWHQDYIYWRNEDHVPTNRIISVMIFLDEVTEFNGPLFFIPGSHKAGCIEPRIAKDAPAGWEGNVSSSLNYQVDNQLVSNLVAAGGLFSAQGKKGTAVWFDGNLVHASPANMSPMQRRIVILTYNAVSNAPKDRGLAQRPEFLNGRDREPLKELELSF
jgi:ectoine hydroxylase